MRELSSAPPDARPTSNAALATLALTALHHIYGGLVYATPWRLHGAAVAVGIGALLIALRAIYARTRHRRLVGHALAVLAIAIPVLAIGVFEGAYNHLIKNLLYFAGASYELLVRMFPPPSYVMANNALFEISGIAQILPAAFAALAAVRFMRALRRHPAAHDRARVPVRCAISVAGDPIEVPDPQRIIHLQFRRFAGCPICNLHLRSFVRRHAEIEAAGIREVIVFHSPAEELRRHVADLPFAVLADPDKRLYREFDVRSGPRALLDPRVWSTIVVAVIRSTVAILRGCERPPSLVPHGGRFGLPADFLISSDGRVFACKHGEHADDQWTVDQVLAEAHAEPRYPRPQTRTA